jgi:hypothetical protein
LDFYKVDIVEYFYLLFALRIGEFFNNYSINFKNLASFSLLKSSLLVMDSNFWVFYSYKNGSSINYLLGYSFYIYTMSSHVNLRSSFLILLKDTFSITLFLLFDWFKLVKNYGELIPNLLSFTRLLRLNVLSLHGTFDVKFPFIPSFSNYLLLPFMLSKYLMIFSC